MKEVRHCCDGDYNPWVPPPVCTHCGDTGRVSKTSASRHGDITPCPFCSDPADRLGLQAEWNRRWRRQAEISENDLTDKERKIVADWRNRGFHMADCLRWIEGQRYDPAKDQEFLARVEEALGKWKRLSGRTK